MKKKDITKRLIPTLLATVYTLPALAGGDDPLNKEAQPVQDPQKTTLTSEAVQQEVIQLVRQGDTDNVTLNIAGQPGTYFRVNFSPTGEKESYAMVPGGEGRIQDNGFGSVGFALKKLGTEEVYLKVITSDTPDFVSTRVTPKPMIIEVDQVQIKERGVVEEVIGNIKQKVEKTSVRTPSAVAGVRG